MKLYVCRATFVDAYEKMIHRGEVRFMLWHELPAPHPKTGLEIIDVWEDVNYENIP